MRGVADPTFRRYTDWFIFKPPKRFLKAERASKVSDVDESLVASVRTRVPKVACLFAQGPFFHPLKPQEAIRTFDIFLINLLPSYKDANPDKLWLFRLSSEVTQSGPFTSHQGHLQENKIVFVVDTEVPRGLFVVYS